MNASFEENHRNTAGMLANSSKLLPSVGPKSREQIISEARYHSLSEI